jgi:hypothetical protein
VRCVLGNAPASSFPVGALGRIKDAGILRVACGLWHDHYSRFRFAVLRAFIDDSGSGGDSPWYVLAGYVGTVSGWELFDERWQRVLAADPAIEYFKASEAESLRPDGQWRGVSKQQRDAKINDLIQVVASCADRAFHVRVRQKDHDEVIKPFVPPEWDNPYYGLFQGCVSSVVANERYSGEGRPVEFVFDSNERLEKPSLRLYDRVKDIDSLTGRIINIHYQSEKDFLPLQAADLLAWQVRRRLCVPNERPRAHYERALYRLPQNPLENVLTREDLERYSRIMDDDARRRWAETGLPEAMRPWKRP